LGSPGKDILTITGYCSCEKEIHITSPLLKKCYVLQDIEIQPASGNEYNNRATFVHKYTQAELIFIS
jgi:hypothetical protein